MMIVDWFMFSKYIIKTVFINSIITLPSVVVLITVTGVVVILASLDVVEFTGVFVITSVVVTSIVAFGFLPDKQHFFCIYLLFTVNTSTKTFVKILQNFDLYLKFDLYRISNIYFFIYSLKNLILYHYKDLLKFSLIK